MIEDRGRKQVDALKDLKPKAFTYESDDNGNISISKRIIMKY